MTDTDNCRTCPYSFGWKEGQRGGSCRRFPPQIYYRLGNDDDDTPDKVKSRFPYCSANMICGEHPNFKD